MSTAITFTQYVLNLVVGLNSRIKSFMVVNGRDIMENTI